MTHEQWAKEVRKTMIDKDMSMTKLAAGLDKSTEWIYQTLCGRKINESMVEKISEYLGIESYLS